MTELYLHKIAWKPQVREQRGEYPFDLPITRIFQELTLRSRVTFLVGENGTGKSTLLEAIAVAYGFNPEGGSRNFCFDTCSTHSPVLMALPGAEIYELTSERMCLTPYEETSHYQITRSFLNHPGPMLKELLKD